MMLFLTVAPASISLPGQILTSGWMIADSPTMVLSPITTPSKMTALRLDAALAADDGASQLHALAHVRVAPDDAAVDVGAVVDDGEIAHHDRAVDDDLALDLDAVTQVDGTIELGVGRDLDVVADPDVAANVMPDFAQLHAAVQQVGRWLACTP